MFKWLNVRRLIDRPDLLMAYYVFMAVMIIISLWYYKSVFMALAFVAYVYFTEESNVEINNDDNNHCL